MADSKERLDVLITERGFCASREMAKRLIMSGIVFVDGQREDKAGTKVKLNAEIILTGNTMKYVSRGGLKLEKAIETFGISCEGRVCMDIGASTGGFTDCMLQNGAVKVYAVDVGYGQLAWKLRCDPRVILMEKTNIRYVTEADIPEKFAFASVDVSFISLTKVLPVVAGLMADDAEIVTLIKPQFEAGREKVGKKGVVKDAGTHCEVITKIVKHVESLDLCALDLTFSPIKGPEGNIEYLLHIAAEPRSKEPVFSINDVVSRAFIEAK